MDSVSNEIAEASTSHVTFRDVLPHFANAGYSEEADRCAELSSWTWDLSADGVPALWAAIAGLQHGYHKRTRLMSAVRTRAFRHRVPGLLLSIVGPPPLLSGESEGSRRIHEAFQARAELALGATTVRSIAKWTVLHYACKCNAPSDVIQALLSVWPAGAGEQAGDGKLPLHLACEAGPKLEVGVVQALLAAFPAGASVVARAHAWADGSLPLHSALSSKAPQPVVTLLLAAYPEGAEKKDKNGKLPVLC